MTDEHPHTTLARKPLILATLGALAFGGLIVLGAILPAEFNKDPLGLGKLTGLSRLWSPAEKEIGDDAAAGPLAREYATPARSDVIEIPLGYAGGGVGPYSLEYKVAMKKGAVLIYEWEAIGLDKPENLAYDFHGHTVPKTAEEEMVVSTHKQANGASGRGSLVAPFDGIQGWYFDNSAQTPVTIRVKVTGFYDLVPSGQPGNEAGIVANQPAAQVKAQMILPRPAR